VRNIDILDDDYGDPDQWDDRSLSNSPDIPTEYLPPPPSSGDDFFSAYISKAQEEQMLQLAAAEVRNVLGENFSKEDVDAALRHADYDPQKAVDHLLENASAPADEGSQSQAIPALKELNEPSEFATLLSSTATSQAAQPAVDLPPISSLRLSEGPKARTETFRFDEPSPDDLVVSRQQEAFTQKRSMPQEEKKNSKSSVKSTGRSSGPAGTENNSRPETDSAEPAVAERSEVKSEPLRKKTAVVKQRATPLPEANLKRERTLVSVVIAGHVDSGKSTMIGQIVSKVGDGGNRRPLRAADNQLAWVLDEDQVERERGVTIDIGVRHIRHPKTNRVITFVDSPGHRDFVPTMILAASMANAAVLMVDASTGEFEAGFSEEGQTREHTVLLRSIGISFLIVGCNKLDTVDFSKNRFDEIVKIMSAFFSKSGFKVPSHVQFIPCSGLTDTNVISEPPTDHPLGQWYKGPTLLDAIDQLAMRTFTSDVNMPTRFIVTESIRNQAISCGATGRLLSGSIAADDKLLLLPQNEVCSVKSVNVVGSESAVALANDSNVTLSLANVDPAALTVGSVLVDPEKPCITTASFRAQIVIMNSVRPIIPGYKAILHVNGRDEAATVAKLFGLVEKNSNGSSKKSKPRWLTKGQTASVQICTVRPVCVENFSEQKAMGRLMLRNGGKTVAVGIVEEA